MEISRAAARRTENLTRLLEEAHPVNGQPTETLVEFQQRYREMPREERPYFFEMLVSRLELRKRDVQGDLQRLLAADEGDAVQWTRLLSELRPKLESPRVAAFRGFLNISGGLKFLLDLRADVLAAQRQFPVNLDPLDEDIAYLFTSWFQQGFLFLQEITQDSPYRQIRFLKDQDLVHPMSSLEEMGNRLGRDHRCFALYHRVMPEEPVVFIEAALTRGIPRAIREILPGDGPPLPRRGTPDTAVFYSINNTQNSLAGLGLGKVLIFRVVDALKRGQSGIRNFVTLSPVPGFWERYLQRILQGDDASFLLKRRRVEEFFPEKGRLALLQRRKETGGDKDPDFLSALLGILSDPKWIEDGVYAEWLRKPLTEITFFYLTREKNRQGKPLNAVASFHLGNGAGVGLRNVNFGANRSPRALREACGMMVNYVYSMTWLQQIGRTVESLLPWNT